MTNPPDLAYLIFVCTSPLSLKNACLLSSLKKYFARNAEFRSRCVVTLINFGILPLTFENEADYDSIGVNDKIEGYQNEAFEGCGSGSQEY